MMKGQSESATQETISGHVLHSVSELLHKFSRWYELHREREFLASLSDEALKDIGISRADVVHESIRPFWDDPIHK